MLVRHVRKEHWRRLGGGVSRNVALRGQGSRQASSLLRAMNDAGEATTSPRYRKYAAGTGKVATGTWPVSPLWCNRPSPCAAKFSRPRDLNAAGSALFIRG